MKCKTSVDKLIEKLDKIKEALTEQISTVVEVLKGCELNETEQCIVSKVLSNFIKFMEDAFDLTPEATRGRLPYSFCCLLRRELDCVTYDVCEEFDSKFCLTPEEVVRGSFDAPLDATEEDKRIAKLMIDTMRKRYPRLIEIYKICTESYPELKDDSACECL